MGLVDAAKKYGKKLYDAGAGVVNTLVQGVKRLASPVINTARQLGAGVVNTVRGGVDALGRAISPAVHQIEQAPQAILGEGAALGRSAITTASQGLQRAGNAGINAGGTILDAARSGGRTIEDAAQDFMQQVPKLAETAIRVNPVSAMIEAGTGQDTSILPISKVSKPLADIRDIRNIPREQADFYRGASNAVEGGLRHIPVVGGMVADELHAGQDLVQSGLRPLAALGELAKGNVQGADRQMSQAPLSVAQRERQAKGQNAAEQFLPAVGLGARLGSDVAPLGKFAKLSQIPIMQAMKYGAAGATINEAGRQLQEDKLNVPALIAAPFAGAGIGAVFPPASRLLNKGISRAADAISGRVIGDLARDANVSSVAQKLRNLGLDEERATTAAPSIAASDTRQGVKDALLDNGIRRIESSGGLVRPKETTVHITTGDPITLNKETGVNPLKDMGGDGELKRDVRRAVKNGEEVVVEPISTIKVTNPSSFQQRMGAVDGSGGSKRNPGIRIVSRTEAPKPEPITEPEQTAVPQTTNEPPPVVETPTTASPVTETEAKTRGLVQSVKDSDLPPEVKEGTQGTYIPSSSKEIYDNTLNDLRNGTRKPGEVESSVFEREAATGKVRDFNQQKSAEGQALAQHYVEQGDYDSAARVYNELAPELTKAGQAIQAASLLQKLRPEGILKYAMELANRNKAKLSPEFLDRLKVDAERFSKMSPDDPMFEFEKFMLEKSIAEQLPASLSIKMINFWKAGLLTGIKTTGGNHLSNVGSFIGEKMSDIFATAIDLPLSAITGRRSKAITIRGTGQGFSEGTGKGWKFIKTGFDERQLASKWDVPSVINNGKGPIADALNFYENLVFRWMGATDFPYYYARKANSLYDQAIVAIRNGEKPAGVNKDKFIEDFIKNPPEEAVQAATAEASYAVFQNDTGLGLLAQNAAKQHPIIGNIIAPFRRTPSAVAMRLVDYSPIGAAKSISKAVRSAVSNGELDQQAQRDLVQNLGRAGTGTGMMWAGMQLYKGGVMTLAYPKDAKERELWKLEGKQPYSIKIGGKWRSLNYASPWGQLLAAGGFVQSGWNETGTITGALTAGIAGAGRTVLDQTFLKGVAGAFNALNYPEQFAERFLEQTVGSIVPTIVADIAQAKDPYQREVNSVGESIKSRLPALRESLNPQLDIFGAPLERKGGPIETMIDPTRPSRVKDDPLAAAFRETAGSGEGLYVPEQISKKAGKIGGVDSELNHQQLFELRQASGQLLRQQMELALRTPGYQSLDAQSKRDVIQEVSKDSRALGRLYASESMGIGNPEVAFDDLSTRAKKIAIGKQPNYVEDVVERKEKTSFEDANKPKIGRQLEVIYSGYLDLPAKSQARRDYLASHPELQKYFDDKSNYLLAYKDKFGELPFGEKEPYKKGSFTSRYKRRSGRIRVARRTRGRSTGGRRQSTGIKIGKSRINSGRQAAGTGKSTRKRSNTIKITA